MKFRDEKIGSTPDYVLDHAAFDLWIQTENADNLADLEKARRLLPIVLNEVVTEKQKKYIMSYYVDQKNVYEIAEEYGVAPSTVSRTIKRGIEKAYGYLRFLSPLFMRPPERRRLKNGAVRRVRKRESER